MLRTCHKSGVSETSCVTAPGTPGRCRRAAAWLIALVLLPLVLLGSAELALRATGFGRSTRPFIERKCDGKTVHFRNIAFIEQFLPWGLPRHVWVEHEFDVTAEKPQDTYRIVVLGGSAALGWPGHQYAFARMLEVMLHAQYPQTRFEVYNASYGGMNSHVMRATAKACRAFRPDLLIVYMGNNEIHGPFGLMNQFQRLASVPRLWAIRANIWLTDLRLLQLIRGPKRAPFVPSLAKVLPQNEVPRITPDDPRLKRICGHFQRNLYDICGYARDAGASVVLATVAVNLRHWTPTVPLGPPDLSSEDQWRWQDLFATGVSLQDERADYRQAADAFERAAAITGACAELRFRMGQCYWELGDYGASRRHYLAAVEFDTFGWARAKPAINEIVRATAARMPGHWVRLADVEAYVARRSPHGIAGIELFCDHCHLNVEGNYAVACALFEQVVAALPQPIRAQRNEPPIALSQAECARRLALTPEKVLRPLQHLVAVDQVLGQEPIDLMKERIAELERQVAAHPDQPELETLREALAINDGDFEIRCEYVQALSKNGDRQRALEQADRLVERFPYRRMARRVRSAALMAAGDLDEAIAECQRLLALYPDDAEAYLLWGTIAQQRGDHDKALGLCRRAYAADPNNTEARRLEGAVLESMGDLEGAARVYREAIASNPHLPAAYWALDALYTQHKDVDRRVADWRTLVELHPDAPHAHHHLGRALEASGDVDAALAAYHKAGDLAADDAAIQADITRLGESMASQRE